MNGNQRMALYPTEVFVGESTSDDGLFDSCLTDR
jgi:hypothetical protein